MSTPWSKRAPYPHDAELDVGDGTGWHGLMLVPTREGLLVGRSTAFLGEVAPTSYEYGAARPDEETTFVFGRLTGGLGERIQAGAAGTRYRYADGVDCSIGGMPRLGPYFTDEAFPGLPAAGPVRQFVVAHDGVNGDVLFALVGRCVYKRVAGAWTLSRDFGANNDPQQAVVFQGSAGTGGLWVATAFGELWRYSGTAWAAAMLPVGATAGNVEAVGRELYIAGSGAAAAGTVRVCTAGDPLLAASWGGPITVGSTGTVVTYLRALGDTLFVFKPDGVHTLNADGSDNDLFPELRGAQRLTNGVNAVPWADRLWFGYGDAYYRMDAAATLEAIGPEQLVELDPALRGAAVAGGGHAGWFFYLGTHDAASGASSLLKYGTWVPAGAPREAGADTGAGRVLGAWHGALARWADRRLTRVDVVQFDTASDPTRPGPALWVGFADGTAAFTPLPTGTPDPVGDPACRFVATGILYAPLHDAVFGADPKAFHGFTALGGFLNEDYSARVLYRVDPTAPYTPLAPAFQFAGQRVDLPDLTTGAERDASNGFRSYFAVELSTTTGLVTPVLEGVALHEAVRPGARGGAMRLAWTFTVDAANRGVRRDGVVSRATGDAVRALLRSAARAAGHVRLRFPDETIGGVALVGYEEVLAPDAGRDGLDERIAVRAVQYR
jgi:hypothetical protein